MLSRKSHGHVQNEEPYAPRDYILEASALMHGMYTITQIRSFYSLLGYQKKSTIEMLTSVGSTILHLRIPILNFFYPSSLTTINPQ